MRRASALAALILCAFGCGDDAPPLPDLMCDEPGTPPDMPALGCPEVVDLGCIDTDGVVLEVPLSVASCDGSEPTVTCAPATGSTVRPGDPSAGSCTAVSSSGASASCEFEVRYRVDGPASLVCAAPVTAECTGSTTAVSVSNPTRMASCGGGELGAPVGDAPDGFERGATTVTFTSTQTDGADLSCTVEVEVEDTIAPTVDCSGLPTEIVRVDPLSPLAFGMPTVTEACDPDPEVSFGPIPDGRGTFDVTATATDAAGLTGSCDVTVEVLDLFPVTELRVLSASTSGANTDVTLGWTPSLGADVTELRVERAASEAGPFEELMTVSTTTNRVSDTLMTAGSFYRVVSLGGETEGGISEVIRARPVESDAYDLSGQSVPTVGFTTSLTGVVRAPPAGDGPHPFVLFIHGNHGNCRPSDGDDQCEERTTHACTDGRFETTPNHEGYVYLQETLASLGYVTASISANALNCRPDYIPERTQLVLEHLRRWKAWSDAAGGPFGDRFVGEIDMGNVALVGHSRGGEAVSSAPAALVATPIAGVSLSSVHAIGPTDFHAPAPAGVPFAVLLPGCDADVRNLEGLRHYDRGLDAVDGNARSQVLFVGANHNFFNTEWRFDDNAGRGRVCNDTSLVGGPAQRGMIEFSLIDWIRAHAEGIPVPSYLRADDSGPLLMDAWAGIELDLRWSYASSSRVTVDDFAGAGAPNTNDLGGMNTYVNPLAAVSCTGGCARNYPHSSDAARLAWQDAPSAAEFAFAATDASEARVLSMRFASRLATINNGLESHDFGVAVEDAAGVRAVVSLADHGRLAHRYPSSVEREILATVRIPLSAFIEAEPMLDTSRLVQVAFEMPLAGGNTQGSVWLDDLEFAQE